MAKKYNIDKVLMSLGKDITGAWKKAIQQNNDTGSLSNSIKYVVKDQILILSMAKEGEYLDKGTKPHMPPVDKITRWAANKGLSPWAVAINISKYGTEAHPFIDKYKPILKKYKKHLRKAGREDIIDIINKGIKIEKN